MKKVLVSICMAGAVVGLSSCASTKNAATLSSLGGEWNIIEINGMAVVPAPGQEFPFLGFDTQAGRIYGNSGCNSLTGTLDVNAKPEKIDFSNLGSTRMMCPDMTLENNVSSALGTIKKYKSLGQDNMALYASSKRPVIVLQKRTSASGLSGLEGKWMVSEAGGEAVPENMEKQPFIEFDINGKKIHGNAGCNIINGDIQTDEASASSISFPMVTSTMMACPDMEVESRILKALNEVRTFGRLAGGSIGLYNADNTLVMVLTQN